VRLAKADAVAKSTRASSAGRKTQGAAWAVHPGEADGELRLYEERLRAAVSFLDERIPAGEVAADELLELVIELMSWVHGEWARSIQIDEALRTDAACNRGLRKTIYLHSSCVPLDRADIDIAQECDGMCGV
jgi:hypothetical protein